MRASDVEMVDRTKGTSFVKRITQIGEGITRRQSGLDVKRDLGLQGFPERVELSDEERIVTAAVCVIQALQGGGPVYCPPTMLKFFKIVNNHNYLLFLRLMALFHATALCALETPPRLYNASENEISLAGYYPRFSRGADIFVCLLYILHCILSTFTSRKIRQPKVENKPAPLFTHISVTNSLVTLLVIDMLINVFAGPVVRPFRCLRPGMYVLLTPMLRTMLLSCTATFPPLLKTFMILICAEIFYATIGLNMFSGDVSESNPFGAACLHESNTPHPFQNFGWSFVTMYVAGTGDNHPMVIWPFFTCSCTVQLLPTYTPGDNSTTLPVPALWSTGQLPWCTSRRVISIIFFMSFMTVVFFCLGNCVLAVCYYFFHQISLTNVSNSILRQRASILTAFYYLDAKSSGAVSKEDFIMVCNKIRYLSKYDATYPEKMFEYLHSEKSGGIPLKSLFRLPDLIQTKLILHHDADKKSGGLYNRRWKHSRIHQLLSQGLDFRVFGLPLVDLTISTLLLITFILFSIESTRRATWLRAVSDAIIVLFVLEAIWKMLADGFHTYWIDLWNKFDLCITVMSIVFYLYQNWLAQYGTSTHKYPLSSFQCIRLLRMLKLLRLVLDRGNNYHQQHLRRQREQTHKTKNLLEEDPATAKNGYFEKILTSLATTIPVCINILVLLFLFMNTFALLGMEILSTFNTNVKVLLSGSGVVDFVGGNQFKFDWADWSSSIISVMIIMVGNTWSTLLIEGMNKDDFWICIFFIIFHFLGRFLILNIIQSLFVSAFSTLLDPEAYQGTIEAQINDHTVALEKDPSVKRVSRYPRLEYLMLTAQSLDETFRNWQTKYTRNGSIVVGRSSYNLAFSPRPPPPPQPQQALPSKMQGESVTNNNNRNSNSMSVPAVSLAEASDNDEKRVKEERRREKKARNGGRDRKASNSGAFTAVDIDAGMGPDVANVISLEKLNRDKHERSAGRTRKQSLGDSNTESPHKDKHRTRTRSRDKPNDKTNDDKNNDKSSYFGPAPTRVERKTQAASDQSNVWS